MIEAWRTFDIGLIRYAANPLAQPMREEEYSMVGVFLQDDQTDAPATTEATEEGEQTRGIHIDTVGTSSIPPPVQSMHIGHGVCLQVS